MDSGCKEPALLDDVWLESSQRDLCVYIHIKFGISDLCRTVTKKEMWLRKLEWYISMAIQPSQPQDS